MGTGNLTGSRGYLAGGVSKAILGVVIEDLFLVKIIKENVNEV